ncbi:MAG: OmpA family protein [Halioglobus sp.]|nr:OmpA family protein [Halioglobus sp.]
MKGSILARFGALAIVAASLVACGGLQKNEALLEAEELYNNTRQNEDVLRYAGAELQRAEKALESAAVAETDGDMTSLAYVGKVRTQTALAIAERKVASEQLASLSKSRDQILLSARESQLQRTQADAEALRRELLALQAVKTDRGMVMTLGDVLFSTGKADLQPGAMSTIRRLADFLAEYPDKTVLIEGFTDSTGSAEFNQGLSERRALSVRSALLDAGVSASRISTEGYGMARPVADNSTAEGRQRNRRVEIVIQD